MKLPSQNASTPVPLDHIARLSKLQITKEETARLQQQLNDIVRLIEQLRQTDTTGVAPLSHPGHITLRMRNDTVTENDQRNSLLPLAPKTSQGFYLVPPFME